MQIHVTCDECGAEMVLRVNSQNGSEFMGCTKYPECRATKPLPEHIRMERMGAKPLPGFGGPFGGR